jgi:hypothetical protein
MEKSSGVGIWALVRALVRKIFLRKKKQQSSIYPLR